MNDILDGLQMTGWYRQIVTDCGSNAKSAFRRDNIWDWMRCACHLLHNVVEAGFPKPGRGGEDPSTPAWQSAHPCLRAVGRAKAFVAHIHHSRKASERFNEKQQSVLEELKGREAGPQTVSGDESDSDETMESVELEPGVPGFDPGNVPNPKRVYRLTSQVDTRWNSRCYMMERWVQSFQKTPLCPYNVSL